VSSTSSTNRALEAKYLGIGSVFTAKKKLLLNEKKVAAGQKRKDASCNANEILEDVTVNKELISISTQPTSSGHIVGNTCKLLLKYL
jgi:hypothetical protein